MYLPDLVDNIPGAFPCQAFLQDTKDMVDVFGSRHLKLIKAATESTLVCSYPGTNDRFELPVDIPEVTVTIAQYDEHMKFQLHAYESTEHIGEFNPAITSCRDDEEKGIYESILCESNPAYIPCLQILEPNQRFMDPLKTDMKTKELILVLLKILQVRSRIEFRTKYHVKDI